MLVVLALVAALMPSPRGALDSGRVRTAPSTPRAADGVPVSASTLGEAVLVELRAGQLVSRPTMAYAPSAGSTGGGERLLVRVADVLALVEAPYDTSLGRAHASLRSERVELDVDARSQIARRGRSRWRPEGGELVSSDVGLLASVRTIARLLDVEATYDRGGATVDLRDVARLPVARRLARAAAHAAYRARAARAPDALDALDATWPKLLDPTHAPALLVDYDAAITRQSMHVADAAATRWVATYATAIALPMIGGKTELHVAGDNDRLGVRDLTWSRAWPEGRLATQLALGDVLVGGDSPRRARGVALSNARPDDGGAANVVAVTGSLPPGWEIEASANGRLVDVATAPNGRYSLAVPVAAGASTVSFLAAGPNGEEREFQRMLHSAPWFVAPRRLEYSLNAGVCASTDIVGTSAAASAFTQGASCAWTASGDVRYGVRQGWVVRSGVDVVQPTGSPRARYAPFVGIGGVVAQSLSLQVTGTPARSSSGGGITALSVQFQPSPALTLSSEVVRSALLSALDLTTTRAASAARNAAETTIESTRRTSMARFAPAAWNDRVSLEAWESEQRWNGTVHSSARAGLAFSAAGVQARPYWRADLARSGTMATRWNAVGLETMLVPSTWLGHTAGTTWLRSQFEAAPGGMSTIDVTVGHAVRGWRIESGVRRMSSTPSAVWTLSASPLLSALQLGARMSGSGQGSTTTQTARGSLVVDVAHAKLALNAEPSAERGGATGFVFFDRNGNGRRDAGEEGLADVIVRVGNRTVTTDSTGSYSVWGVESLAELPVSVDSMSLTSPWWIPAASGMRVRVPSVGWARADVPVVSAGVIDGTVVVANDLVRALPASMRVIATPSGGGDPVVMTTFSDGTFYRDALRPGRYTLAVDAETLAGTDLVSGTATIVVRSEKQVTNVRLPLTAVRAGP